MDEVALTADDERVVAAAAERFGRALAADGVTTEAMLDYFDRWPAEDAPGLTFLDLAVATSAGARNVLDLAKWAMIVSEAARARATSHRCEIGDRVRRPGWPVRKRFPQIDPGLLQPAGGSVRPAAETELDAKALEKGAFDYARFHAFDGEAGEFASLRARYEAAARRVPGLDPAGVWNVLQAAVGSTVSTDSFLEGVNWPQAAQTYRLSAETRVLWRSIFGDEADALADAVERERLVTFSARQLELTSTQDMFHMALCPQGRRLSVAEGEAVMALALTVASREGIAGLGRPTSTDWAARKLTSSLPPPVRTVAEDGRIIRLAGDVAKATAAARRLGRQLAKDGATRAGLTRLLADWRATGASAPTLMDLALKLPGGQGHTVGMVKWAIIHGQMGWEAKSQGQRVWVNLGGWLQYAAMRLDRGPLSLQALKETPPERLRGDPLRKVELEAAQYVHRNLLTAAGETFGAALAAFDEAARAAGGTDAREAVRAGGYAAIMDALKPRESAKTLEAKQALIAVWRRDFEPSCVEANIVNVFGADGTRFLAAVWNELLRAANGDVFITVHAPGVPYFRGKLAASGRRTAQAIVRLASVQVGVTDLERLPLPA